VALGRRCLGVDGDGDWDDSSIAAADLLLLEKGELSLSSTGSVRERAINRPDFVGSTTKVVSELVENGGKEHLLRVGLTAESISSSRNAFPASPVNLLLVRLRSTDEAGPYAHLFAFVSACGVILKNPGLPASPTRLQEVEYP
jgi:hypothetical protein